MNQQNEGKDCGAETRFPPGVRIVVEFDASVSLPAIDGADRELDKCGRKFWEYLLCRFADLGEVSLRPSLRRVDREKLERLVATARKLDPTYRGTAAKFLRYFDVIVPYDADRIESLRDSLRRWEQVRSVHLHLVAEPPGSVLPTAGTGAYINAAPEGLDFRYAWEQEAFDGAGLKFLDLEQAYARDHPYLPAITEIPAGSLSSNWTSTRHGTGVLGVIASQGDAEGPVTDGVSGIAPRCAVHFASTWYPGDTPVVSVSNVEATLLQALTQGTFGPGDVMLIEEQSINTRTSLYVPVEQKAAVFDAIRLATALGIVVVEPAGNRSGWASTQYQNLDDPENRVDGTIDGVFEPSLNRSDPSFIDSGAIVVGSVKAAVNGERHERRSDSNYGSRVDCYAWGDGVPSCDVNYSGAPVPRNFVLAKTSAAAAIIAGAALVIQAKAKAKYGAALSPQRVRELLSTNGTPVIPPIASAYGSNSGSGNATAAEVVGVMPDLRRILELV